MPEQPEARHAYLLPHPIPTHYSRSFYNPIRYPAVETEPLNMLRTVKFSSNCAYIADYDPAVCLRPKPDCHCRLGKVLLHVPLANLAAATHCSMSPHPHHGELRLPTQTAVLPHLPLPHQTL